ncbi:MAG: protein-disulfide reductase DsbD N-terminal domain-containing protein, partial [Muribaculaceae bacterium]|nr:protein-disulfide reductase DsbD N-terminal domain-containing protein [Muribaculaceae bacterium]
VVITATVDDGWYIYDTKKVDGVTATKFDFAFAGVEFDGGIKASSAPNKKIDDKTLGTTLYGWTGKVKFERKFTVTEADKATIDVTVTYMACNGKSCTAPKTETITVNIK